MGCRQSGEAEVVEGGILYVCDGVCLPLQALFQYSRLASEVGPNWPAMEG